MLTGYEMRGTNRSLISGIRKYGWLDRYKVRDVPSGDVFLVGRVLPSPQLGGECVVYVKMCSVVYVTMMHFWGGGLRRTHNMGEGHN